MDILELIPFGRENAITRAELCRLTKLDDRTVRETIERSRKDGNIIISSNYHSGYWQSEDAEEQLMFIREYDMKWKTQQGTSTAMLRSLCEQKKAPASAGAPTSASENTLSHQNNNPINGGCQE